MAHQGQKSLTQSFNTVWQKLNREGTQHLITENGNEFEASADVAALGRFQEENVIRIQKNDQTFALIFACCWGHSTNDYGTRIGGYSGALDKWN